MGLLNKLFLKKPDKDQFAKLVASALEKGGASNLRYDPSDFSLRVGSKDRTFFLDNAYRDYCHSENESGRKAGLARYVSSFLQTTQTPGDFASAKANLMPMVREAAYFSLAQLKFRADGVDASKLEYASRPIAAGLVAALAYDTEHNIMSVNQSTLQQWGAAFDAALEIATHNLRDRTPSNGFKQIAASLYVSQFGDCYDSARLLLPDLLYRLQLHGDPILFVPNRDQLWVTGRCNSPGIAAILKLGPDSHFNQGHGLSPNLYLLSDGKLVNYLPEDPAQREAILSIQRRRDVMDYAQQTEYLNAIHERENIDVFVASCSAYKRKDQGTFTLCVWTNGIDTLLPRTDHIAFLVDKQRNDHFTVPWESAFPVVEELLEVQPDWAPVRYRVRNFPDTPQLAQLRKRARPIT
jgi:hypothetical protein